MVILWKGIVKEENREEIKRTIKVDDIAKREIVALIGKRKKRRVKKEVYEKSNACMIKEEKIYCVAKQKFKKLILISYFLIIHIF